MSDPRAAAPVRVLIVDDEVAARARIRRVLERMPDLAVVGECATGPEAVAAVPALRPDLLLLDMQMPGLTGLGVVKALGAGAVPLVIFVTAFEEYAVRAFEACALDYILKPFEDDRLVLAVERAKGQLRQRQPGAPDDPRMRAFVDYLARGAGGPPDVIAVKVGLRFVVVRVDEIDWIAADGNESVLHLGERTVLVGQTLRDLERHVLDAQRFVRIHRSTLVNVARIAAIEPVGGDELWVVLADGTRLACSRGYRPTLRARIPMTR
jgi:two-component system LytT family response regulator